ncbi:MAG: SUMF1/EgtB/PvdO family nonheme iron enzyme [Acidobacteriota bacterium]|nr:SUMF1/EgtB/PvdO family nonheme iron enzyme [Acidobacteriota bacterium]
MLRLALVLGVLLCAVSLPAAQPPVGALVIDERQGDRYGWAVDYETAGAAQAAALGECGSGCSVVLTFNRCAAYAADQDVGSTAVGWAESYTSADGARQAALAECRSRHGSGCIVRVWGCNGPVVEERLGLDGAARRRLQQALEAAGFDPGGADGVFGPRTRAAIRSWQSSWGRRTTGYLDAAQVDALRDRGTSPPPATTSPSPASANSSAEVEVVFWQSIVNSTNPADFEAYLRQFPSGAFRPLAENRLTALRAPASVPPAVGGAGSPATGTAVANAPALDPPNAAGGEVRARPGDVFRDCDVCPEMVVMPGGHLALGRYEVTVGEYRAFAAATGGGGGGGGCSSVGLGDSWRDPGFLQTNRHPVTCVNWHDAQTYLSWLSRRTGAKYRLPTVAEWVRAAAGARLGCVERYRLLVDRREGTCEVGSHGANSAGLSDMAGNVGEWLEECWEDDCRRRRVGGGDWSLNAEYQRPGRSGSFPTDLRQFDQGFRVARALE